MTDAAMPNGPSTAQPDTAPLSQSSFEPRAAEPTARRGAILVIEDRDDVRQGLAQLLEFQGYMVFEAANAAEAFGHLDSSPQGIALMLLDLNLPGPGGADIRATQLADARLADIPTIVVTACAPDLADREGLRAAAWIEKPFRFDQLLEEVRRFVLPETEKRRDPS
ncbi:MAG TPA: response regulator [Vicinamibacterales bacterium]|nr:response regulator [Vicinamibacterales bacterium]